MESQTEEVFRGWFLFYPCLLYTSALDAESRKAKQEADDLRASRNRISKEIGALMGQGKKEEAEAKKAEVAAGAKPVSYTHLVE